MLSRGNLELVLEHAAWYRDGAARAMPCDRESQPGVWNRIIIRGDDLPTEVARLRPAQLHFRDDMVLGPIGSEILLDEP